jgi:hypothetical protein
MMKVRIFWRSGAVSEMTTGEVTVDGAIELLRTNGLRILATDPGEPPAIIASTPRPASENGG